MPKKFSELIEGRLRPTVLTRLDNDWSVQLYTTMEKVREEIIDPFSVPVANEVLGGPAGIDMIIVNLNKTGDEPEKIIAAIKEIIRDIDAMYIFGHLSDVYVLTQVFKYVEINNEKAIIDFRYAIDDDFSIDDLTKFVAGKQVAFFPDKIKDVTDDNPAPPGVHRLAESKLECAVCGKIILIARDDGMERLICSSVFDAYKKIRKRLNRPDGFDDGETPIVEENIAVPFEIHNVLGKHSFETLASFLLRKFKMKSPNVAKEMTCYGSQEIGCPGYKYRLGEFYCRGFGRCGDVTAANMRRIAERIKETKQ